MVGRLAIRLSGRLQHMTSTEPELIVQPGAPVPGSLMIRVSPDMAEDLEAELRAAGIEPGHAAEFASGPEMVLLTVQISAVGGSLAAVLRTVFHRNDGKRLRLDTDTGRVEEAAGYSVSELERALEVVAKYSARLDRDWERATARDEPDDEQSTDDR
jgi:hypothetical protein